MRDILTSNSSFELLRTKEYLYVDKTQWLLKLARKAWGHVLLFPSPSFWKDSLSLHA